MLLPPPLVSLSRFSLAGLVVVMNKQVAHSIDLSNAFTSASGALLAASFLHIIPEAMEGLAGEDVSLHDMGLNAGLSVLVRLFLSICIRAMLEAGDTEGAIDEKALADRTAVAGEGAAGTAITHTCGSARPRLSPRDNLWDSISARKGEAAVQRQGPPPFVLERDRRRPGERGNSLFFFRFFFFRLR